MVFSTNSFLTTLGFTPLPTLPRKATPREVFLWPLPTHPFPHLHASILRKKNTQKDWFFHFPQRVGSDIQPFFWGGGVFVGRNSLKVSKKKNVCQLPIFVEGPNLIYFHRWEGPNCSWTRTQESCQYSHFWWPAYGWTLKKWCLSKFGISNLLCLGVYFQVHSVWFLWMYKIYKYTNARQLQYHSFCPTGFDIDSKQSEYCTQPFLFCTPGSKNLKRHPTPKITPKQCFSPQRISSH